MTDHDTFDHDALIGWDEDGRATDVRAAEFERLVAKAEARDAELGLSDTTAYGDDELEAQRIARNIFDATYDRIVAEAVAAQVAGDE